MSDPTASETAPVSDHTVPACRDGRTDVMRAIEDLAGRLPEALSPLARLAYNYRWSWTPGGAELFQAIDGERFELCCGNPVRLLQEASGASLARGAADLRLIEEAARLERLVSADAAREPDSRLDAERPVAFLCAEYAIHASLPVYSGGLGALAGDILKEASDRALPMVAVGLMYRKGYFRQRLDASGWQHEYWIDTDPKRLPAALVTTAGTEPLTIEVPIDDRAVRAQIWRVDVGRVPLYLLDSDLPENGPIERWITARLYDADPETRLAQYVLLGVGGIRALRAMGIDPGVVHLNEGHAALAPLELGLGDPAARNGRSLHEALEHARARTVFTTHTPVPAGNDSYPADHIQRMLTALYGETDDLIGLGRTYPENLGEPFGVTQAALRLSRAANGVSRRHGEVAREMWSALWPDRAVEHAPIAHVTNGVHVPTWVGQPMRELLDRRLGQGWIGRAADPSLWEAVESLTDEELWDVRRRQRAELVEYIRTKSANDRLLRGDVREYIEAAARGFDADVLTVGFARRVATYKRLHLLTRDPEWTLQLLGGERPVQIVLAGKAHPRDEEAKRTLQGLFGLKYARLIRERVVFLDDYDLASAARLVRGCDVWLNVPRPPLEASGTSGMKSAFNGGLQVSVLDGWWAEAFDGANGWALPGEVDQDHGAQDHRDAERLHQVIDHEVLPEFYARDERGLPQAWLTRIRRSLQTLGPRFCATRMLTEYVDGPYRGR